MKIDYLGHSEILINIKNSNKEEIKILSDTWLSDWSVADLMQRNPIINIDYSKLDLDLVFISHSHMDHFDPYTLVKIYSKLKNKPLLLLPETLVYTRKLLEDELNCEIKILKNKETFQYKGINIQGIIFPDWMNTNEADVMTLAVWNDEEIVFSEIDVVPPDTEDGMGYVYKLFTQKDFKTRLYLSTRNELEGNLTILDLEGQQSGINPRIAFAQEYEEKRIQEIYQHYNNVFALEEEGISANIYILPGFVRGFIGQGIIYPVKEFGCEALKLQIMSLEENVELEKEISADYGLDYNLYALNKVGNQMNKSDEIRGDCVYEWLGRYIFKDGDLQNVEKIPYLEGEYFKANQDLTIDFSRKLKDEPVLKVKELYEDLSKKEGDSKDFLLNKAIDRVLTYLNTRFLPYQLGRLDANLKNLALENDGKYRIKLKIFRNNKVETLGYFQWNLGTLGFIYIGEGVRAEGEDFDTFYQEVYFIEDLINFLDGKIELYSNFWSYLEPGTNIYLWECLGANFINNDIVLKKFKYHFDLAKKGLKSEEFIKKILFLNFY